MEYAYLKSFSDVQKPIITKWVKDKLTEVTGDCDDVFLEYVMVMVANKKTMKQIGDDLIAFVGDDASNEFAKSLGMKLLEMEKESTSSEASIKPIGSTRISSKVVSKASIEPNAGSKNAGHGTSRLLQSALRSTIQSKTKRELPVIEDDVQIINDTKIKSQNSDQTQSVNTTKSAVVIRQSSAKRGATPTNNASLEARETKKQRVVEIQMNDDTLQDYEYVEDDIEVEQTMTTTSIQGATETHETTAVNTTSVTVDGTPSALSAPLNTAPQVMGLGGGGGGGGVGMSNTPMGMGLGMGMGMGMGLDPAMYMQQMNAYASMSGFANVEQMMAAFQQNMTAMMTGGNVNGNVSGTTGTGMGVSHHPAAASSSAPYPFRGSGGRFRGRGGYRGGSTSSYSAGRGDAYSVTPTEDNAANVNTASAVAAAATVAQEVVSMPSDGLSEGNPAVFIGKFSGGRGFIRGRGGGAGREFTRGGAGRRAMRGRGGPSAPGRSNMTWVRETDMESSLSCGR
eukprot:gene11060-23121_t